ncbi:unnamed protein product [Calicophoron daubneyi]
MKTQTRIIDDEIKRYKEKYREMLKANDEYTRIEADSTHSVMDVDKAMSYARLKNADFERARKDYTAAINQFNMYRRDHFTRTLPMWTQLGYDLEEDRHKRTNALLGVLYERLNVAVDRMRVVCSELQNISSVLNIEEDVKRLLSSLQGGNPPPGDIAIVDLAAAGGSGSLGGDFETTSDHSSNGPAYVSTSLVLPPNFHCSVSAADYAALEGTGALNNNNSGAIYAGTGSVYSAFSALVGGAASRRQSSSNNNYAVSPSGHGPGLFKRFFSRRSRSVANVKHSADGLIDGGYARDTGQFSDRHARDLDSSDFSDSSPEVDNCGVLDENPKPEAAYASTSILAGLPQRIPGCTANSHQSSTCLVEQKNQSAEYRVQAPAPLAEPESLSLAPQCASDRAQTSNPSQVPISKTNPQDDPQVGQTNDYTRPSSVEIIRQFSPKRTHLTDSSSSISEDEKTTQKQLPMQLNPSVQSQNHSLQQNNRAPTRPPPFSFTKCLVSEASSDAASATLQHGGSKHTSDALSGLPDADPDDNLDKCAKTKTVFVSSADDKTAVDGARRSHHSPSPAYASAVNTSIKQEQRGKRGSSELFFPHRPNFRTTPPKDTVVVVGTCTALYTFTAEGFESCYLPFAVGDQFYTLAPSPTEDTTDWLRVLRHENYESGFVPTSYVEQHRFSQPQILATRSAHVTKSPTSAQQLDSHSYTHSQSAMTSPVNHHSRKLRASKPLPYSAYSKVTGIARDTEL